MLKEFNILRQHGIQFVKDVKNVSLNPLFRGRPEISLAITDEEKEIVSKLCPANAFIENPFALDLGKCVFCKECHFACPDKIIFTNDYKIATNERSRLLISPGMVHPITLNPSLIRPEIKSLFKNALKLRQVSAAGDNSCEMELNAAGNVNFDMGRYGIEFVASPRHADGIVITGPLSVNMERATRITWEAVPSPKIIVLAGTDAISGGMYQGSSEINRTFLEENYIDLYIPGNPLHPLTFINGLLELTGR
jgi:Ni,Fe-hydrogenase III small subunit/NAD-dependent dihydropyrimidine dehydrogenase PreA subunit